MEEKLMPRMSGYLPVVKRGFIRLINRLLIVTITVVMPTNKVLTCW
jgi:hypothetical protein